MCVAVTFEQSLKLPSSFGDPLETKIKYAPEPEAIKWENIHVSKPEIWIRHVRSQLTPYTPP